MGYDRKPFDLESWVRSEGERAATTYAAFKAALLAKGYPADRVDAAALQLTCAHMQAHATKMAAKGDSGGRY